MNTYPEMNGKIVGILELSEEPTCLYAAARIKELENIIENQSFLVHHEIKMLLDEAVNTDGAHHKQWYLEEIAEKLKVELPTHDNGVAP